MDGGGILLRVVVMGVVATAATDLWAVLLRRLGRPTLDYALLGRWIGHWRAGRWRHAATGTPRRSGMSACWAGARITPSASAWPGC